MPEQMLHAIQWLGHLFTNATVPVRTPARVVKRIEVEGSMGSPEVMGKTKKSRRANRKRFLPNVIPGHVPDDLIKENTP